MNKIVNRLDEVLYICYLLCFDVGDVDDGWYGMFFGFCYGDVC